MSTLYIAEYAEVVPMPPGHVGPFAMGPPIAEQVVTVSGTTAASAAFNAKTRLVRIHTDAIVSIAFGTAPVATTSLQRMAASQTEYFGVPVGAAYKVAAITNT